MEEIRIKEEEKQIVEERRLEHMRIIEEQRVAQERLETKIEE